MFFNGYFQNGGHKTKFLNSPNNVYMNVLLINLKADCNSNKEMYTLFNKIEPHTAEILMLKYYVKT